MFYLWIPVIKLNNENAIFIYYKKTKMNFDAPTLENLNDFVMQAREPIEEKNTVQYLYNDAQKYGYYWLYGQLKMKPYEPLTSEKIEEAIAINTQRLRDYGGPCNSMEMYSMAEHEKKFRLLQNTIEKYYQFRRAPL
jgi:hypothetical protein